MDTSSSLTRWALTRLPCALCSDRKIDGCVGAKYLVDKGTTETERQGEIERQRGRER